MAATKVAAGNHTVNATAPAGDEFVACGQTGVTITGGSASQSVNVPSGGAGDGQFYVTSTNSAGATVLGVIDAQTGTWRENVPAPGARNVAALASNNHIFAVVRSPAAGTPDTTLCTQFGIRDTGCVAVFGHK